MAAAYMDDELNGFLNESHAISTRDMKLIKYPDWQVILVKNQFFM